MRSSAAVAFLLILAPLAWSKKPAPTPPPPPPVVVAPPPPVAAPEGEGETPARIAEYRHKVMSAAGGHTGALFMIIKGESKRTGDILGHAVALDEIARLTPDLFPAGTGPDHAVDTESKAEIWTNTAEFAAAAASFQKSTAALVEAAKGGDMATIKPAVFAVGGSCGDCHDKFRVDEEHH